MAGWRQRLTLTRQRRREEREYETTLARSRRHAHGDHPDYRVCCCCGLCACPACRGAFDLGRLWCVRCLRDQHHIVRAIYGSDPVHANAIEEE